MNTHYSPLVDLVLMFSNAPVNQWYAFNRLHDFVSSERYKGFKSSFDNGWERGFVLQQEDKFSVLVEAYEGGAGNYEIHEFGSAIEVMKKMCCLMLGEVGKQEGVSLLFRVKE